MPSGARCVAEGRGDAASSEPPSASTRAEHTELARAVSSAAGERTAKRGSSVEQRQAGALCVPVPGKVPTEQPESLQGVGRLVTE